MHTSAVASPTESFSNFNLNWLYRESKKDTKELLDESDQAETAQKEREQIRQKCTASKDEEMPLY
jgi:hypothetical protein